MDTHTHSSLLGRRVLLCPARCHSTDVYRQHLLQQLGRSGLWQTTSKLTQQVAPLSLEVEGQTGRELKTVGSVTVTSCPCLPSLAFVRQPVQPHLSAGWSSRVCFPPLSLCVLLLSGTGSSEQPALVCWKASDCQRGLSCCHSQVSHTLIVFHTSISK